MDKPRSPINDLCIVVHSDPLVAADLADILRMAGADANAILTVSKLSQAPAGSARVVIIEARGEAISADPHEDYWRQLDVPVLMLDGGSTQKLTDLPENVHLIDQPFRTEDVIAALKRFNIF